jgi:hypothetical protein
MRVAPSPQPTPAAALDAQARRLLWRCRRGMKELDVMLERFAREALAHAAPQERRALEELLSLIPCWLSTCWVETPRQTPNWRAWRGRFGLMSLCNGGRRYSHHSNRHSRRRRLNFQVRSQSTQRTARRPSDWE